MMGKLKRIAKMPFTMWLMVVTYLPGDEGILLRNLYWKKRLKYLGRNVRIDTGVYFQNPKYIAIDDNSWIDKDVMVLAGLDESTREKILIENKDYKGEPGVVSIGKNVHVAPGCILSGIEGGIYISDNCAIAADSKLYAFTHHYRFLKDTGRTTHFGPLGPHECQCLITGPISLGFNSGIAVNSVLLPGVSIQENCFVKISSVVYSGIYKKNSVIAGNPAQEISIRFVPSE